MKIFLTGGAGYIGSHTLTSLLEAGHQVAVVDNYSNSSEAVPAKVGDITGQPFETHNADVTDQERLNEILGAFQPDIVIHFAGRKSVAESVERPEFYHHQNVGGTQNLLTAMDASDCRHIIFSSSATVYGAPEHLPITETHPLAPFNPYGTSKQAAEEAITAWVNESANVGYAKSAVLLRYFNPVGAHISGQIGENPKGRPNNLFPFITQVAAAMRPYLEIYGNDYDTPDGTGVRDYIHITDLVDGHIAALDYALKHQGVEIFNLGTGKGYSVSEIVTEFERATGQQVPHKIEARRPGDIATCFADVSKARDKLGWVATRDLSQMCRDSWRWQEVLAGRK